MSNLELAKKRNRDAAERTLLAWIRTSLSLISFGFGIDRVVSALNNAVGVNDPAGLTRILGLAFILLGTLAMLGATVQHRRELQNIRRRNYTYMPELSISLIVAVSLFGVGLFAFFGILLGV